jgi:hypothetical protein
MTGTVVDPARCPVCGASNGCAMAAGGDGKCWCVDVRMSPEALARIPA